MTKLSDYGILVLTCFAARQDEKCTARDIASVTRLPLPVVSKALKLLTRSGLLSSQRGVKGGYSLAQQPEKIAIAAIIHALEGPIAVTQCAHKTGSCELETGCPVRTNWQLINHAIQSALERITLADMMQTLHEPMVNLPLAGRRFQIR